MIPWRQRVEHVYDASIMAEDDRGDLWLPQRRHVILVNIDGRRYFMLHGDQYWDRRFKWWNPCHWHYWLRARITMRLSMIEVN